LQTLTFTGHEFVLLGTRSAAKDLAPGAWGLAVDAGCSEKLGHGGTFPDLVKTQIASSRLSAPDGSGRPGCETRDYAGKHH